MIMGWSPEGAVLTLSLLESDGYRGTVTGVGSEGEGGADDGIWDRTEQGRNPRMMASR